MDGELLTLYEKAKKKTVPSALPPPLSQVSTGPCDPSVSVLVNDISKYLNVIRPGGHSPHVYGRRRRPPPLPKGWKKRIFLRKFRMRITRRKKVPGNVSVFCQMSMDKRFSSREEQGEFIFLTGIILAEAIGNSVCEINVEEDKYYVSPSCPNSGVFINGVRILTKAELKFGDTLSIGNPHHKNPQDSGFTLDFLFKEKELDRASNNLKDTKIQSENGTKEFQGEFTPGQNELILSHILSHLPTKELKSARFVSKLWSEEGFKVLKKRVLNNQTLDLTMRRHEVVHPDLPETCTFCTLTHSKKLL